MCIGLQDELGTQLHKVAFLIFLIDQDRVVVVKLQITGNKPNRDRDTGLCRLRERKRWSTGEDSDVKDGMDRLVVSICALLGGESKQMLGHLGTTREKSSLGWF